MFNPRTIADETEVIIDGFAFIKDNYKEMYRKWAAISETEFYEGN